MSDAAKAAKLSRARARAGRKSSQIHKQIGWTQPDAAITDVAADRARLLREALEYRNVLRHAKQIISRRGGNPVECLRDIERVLEFEPKAPKTKGKT